LLHKTIEKWCGIDAAPTLRPSGEVRTSRGVLLESNRDRPTRSCPQARAPGSDAVVDAGSSPGSAFSVSSTGVRTIQDSTKRPPRVNRQIRISPVRVIGADGSQLGILEVDAALSMAQELGLDLVEVAAAARPPVVRIMDYGKFKFEQAKQARLAKKKQHVIHLKEVKYRPGIDDHDFDTKTRHARKFLEEGNKVKVTLMFRGRQIAHPELGRAVVERVSQELADLAKIESAPTMEGKSMTMILAPK
jgi:translation initiation factor IF-3